VASHVRLRAIPLLLFVGAALLASACSGKSGSTQSTSTLTSAHPSAPCRAAFDSTDPTKLIPTLTKCDDLDDWLAGLSASRVAEKLEVANRSQAKTTLASLCEQAVSAVQSNALCRAVKDQPTG